MSVLVRVYYASVSPVTVWEYTALLTPTVLEYTGLLNYCYVRIPNKAYIFIPTVYHYTGLLTGY